jgi:hypothetical protein
MEQDELLRRVVEALERLRLAEGGSDKHLRDIAGILRVSPAEVDRGYVAEWAQRLGVTAIWEAVLGK